MGTAVRLEATEVNPYLMGGVGMVAENLKQGFLATQGDGRANQPLRPDGSYGLRLADGRVLTPDQPLPFDLFGGKHPEAGLPFLEADFVESDAPLARPDVPSVAGPVVIGTGADAGKVLGFAVGGVQRGPQQDPLQVQPEGQARTGQHLPPGWEP